MDFLSTNDENKSHYVYMKDFNRFMFNKIKYKIKNTFSDFFFFSSERDLMEDREVSLEINGKQSVKLEIGKIKFKNYFKQIVVPFKIYADLESLLKGLQINDKNKNTSCTEKYQDHIPCSFADKVVCIGYRFGKPVVFIEEKMQSKSLS